MAYQLGDVFIGKFSLSQRFGVDPARYSIYNLRGHNGVDFLTPSMTQVLSAADGWVSEIGFDSGGYGKYVKVVHNGYLTLYAHLNDVIVHEKDHVVAGQLLAHSNNSGFSTGPHLHFGVAPCDLNGLKTQPQNGFSGYIDPMGPDCVWSIKNLTEPVVPGIHKTPISVDPDIYTDLVTKATNWDITAAFFMLSDVERISPKSADVIILPQVEKLKQDNAILQKRIEDLSNGKTPLEANGTTTLPENLDVTISQDSVKTNFSQEVVTDVKKVNAFRTVIQTLFGWMVTK